MTTNLRTLWEINHRWRMWMDENTGFKTPDTLDCLRYSVCEAAEALDAWMRQKNQHHARNNGREHTVEQELADVAMLLLTALPEESLQDWHLVDNELNSLEQLSLHIAFAVEGYKRGFDSWTFDVMIALRYIEEYPNHAMAWRLAECHSRLAMKHGQAAYVIGLQLNCEAEPWLIEEVDNAFDDTHGM